MALDQPEVATVVEREVRIAARPETVFEFFTDPEKMVLWKGRQASLDPRPGGIYRVEMGDQIVARTMMTVTLSADHRVVDGATAAAFLGTLRQLLEEPGLMLV